MDVCIACWISFEDEKLYSHKTTFTCCNVEKILGGYRLTAVFPIYVDWYARQNALTGKDYVRANFIAHAGDGIPLTEASALTCEEVRQIISIGDTIVFVRQWITNWVSSRTLYDTAIHVKKIDEYTVIDMVTMEIDAGVFENWTRKFKSFMNGKK